MLTDSHEAWAGEATGRGSAAPMPGRAGAGPERAGGTSRIVVADDGVELYVMVDGPAGAETTIVFCHGLSSCLDCWENQRTAFAGKARVVTYDQRGHNRSGRGVAGSATIAQLGRDLHRILDEVVPAGPVVLVGHSMGGMTIMALAQAHPELFGRRITGVALLATSAGGLDGVTLGLPAYGARLLRPLVPALLRLLGDDPPRPGRHAVDEIVHLLVRRYSFTSQAPSDVREAAVRLICSAPAQVFRDFYPALMAYDGFAALAALREIPTLILAGGDDLVTPAGHSEAIARALPSARLVVLPETGHNLMLERPLSVNAALGRLLRLVARPEPALRELSAVC
ncbi:MULTISPECIES: alpha/beta fold hydrolase [unclassified Microbispora]|uniref:alpha/beta fold hydrolase n=1 Tax=unclassified Microbispora TaxID=2614687 RepID=UPI0014736807|nr:MULTISPECIES: alpha/beta hydrolase [unclassified Microbispora]